MIYNSDSRPRYSASEMRSIRIGYAIHRKVCDEGARESEGRQPGAKVFAYLDHDLIGSGRLPFVKYDQSTHEISRKFSAALAKEIKDHVEDLKVYFRYVLDCDRIEDEKERRRRADITGNWGAPVVGSDGVTS